MWEIKGETSWWGTAESFITRFMIDMLYRARSCYVEVRLSRLFRISEAIFFLCFWTLSTSVHRSIIDVILRAFTKTTLLLC